MLSTFHIPFIVTLISRPLYTPLPDGAGSAVSFPALHEVYIECSVEYKNYDPSKRSTSDRIACKSTYTSSICTVTESIYMSTCACLQRVAFETSWLLLQKTQYRCVHYGWISRIPNCSFLPATLISTDHSGSSANTFVIRHTIQYETSGQVKPLFTGFIYFLNSSFSFVLEVSTHNQAVTQSAMFCNKAKRFLLRWKLNIVTDLSN